MALHYNAFISYRHHPDDIRVATDIHRSLERFHVPRSLRKKTGQIKRIFRDKEELPITCDLNDDIDLALRNSDYLIVICSVHTKESIWVQREIEYFLQTHRKNKVLTVLASGEPYDVIPEILLYDDVVDPVTGETRRIQIEPLSCDWRGKRKRAIREELPRLAATLLGCSYDELRQRQKQYRARRNMAIVSSALAASLCLTAYFLHTSITIQRANIQIQANLNQSLINQSRHLATAAQERLANGDRLTAIALAKAALPGEGNERPYVPEAENVLISSLGLYRTSNQPAAVGTVSPGPNIGITDFWVSDEQNVLYIYDKRKNITVWDTQTLQKTGEFSLDEIYLDKLMLLPNGNALVLAGLGADELYCYQPDGTLLWQHSDCPDMAYISGDNLVALIHSNGLNSYELLLLDAATGKAAGQPLDLKHSNPLMSPTLFVDDSLPAGAPAVIRYYTFGTSELWSVDLKTGEKVQLPTKDAYPEYALVTGDGMLLMMGEADGLGIAGAFGSDRVTSAENRSITCFDLRGNAYLWESSISNSVYGSQTIQEIPGSDRFLIQSGNVFQVLNKATGETLSRCEAGSGILTVSAGEQSASAVLQDGYVCYYWYGGNYCYEVKSMDNDVSLAAVGEKWYALHTGQDYITVYTSVMGEPEWTSTLDWLETARNKQISGKNLAFQDYSYFYLFDTETREFRWAAEKGSNELLGFSADGQKLRYAEGKTAVTEIDLVTGEFTTTPIPLDAAGSGAEIRGKLYQQGDSLYYVVSNPEKPLLVCWNLSSGETTALPISFETEEEVAYWSWEPLAVSGSSIWLWGHEKVLLEVNLAAETIEQLSSETPWRPCVAIRADGQKAAIANAGKLCLKTPGEANISEIVLESANAGSLYFHGSELLVLCDNGTLYRMDENGQEIAQTALVISSDFADRLLSSSLDPTSISWQTVADHTLVVNALGMGNVVDCENWAVRTSIADLLMYDENNHKLICQLGNTIAAYPLYNTGKLLEMATDALGNFRLTREQQVSYGID